MHSVSTLSTVTFPVHSDNIQETHFCQRTLEGFKMSQPNLNFLCIVTVSKKHLPGTINWQGPFLVLWVISPQDLWPKGLEMDPANY